MTGVTFCVMGLYSIFLLRFCEDRQGHWHFRSGGPGYSWNVQCTRNDRNGMVPAIDRNCYLHIEQNLGFTKRNFLNNVSLQSVELLSQFN